MKELDLAIRMEIEVEQLNLRCLMVPSAATLILPSKPSITFWNSLKRDCQMTSRGSNLDSNLNCAA